MRSMDTIMKCPVCGRSFVAKRSTAVYCSSACRAASHRRRNLEDDLGYIVQAVRMAPPRPVEPRPATVDNVADAVMQARAASTALRRYALSGQPSVRALCMRVAQGIDDALREAGL